MPRKIPNANVEPTLYLDSKNANVEPTLYLDGKNANVEPTPYLDGKREGVINDPLATAGVLMGLKVDPNAEFDEEKTTFN